MRVVVTSDTHGMHESCRMPQGDVLVFAGDMTMSGDVEDVAAFNRWIGGLDYARKIVIAGNHDFCFERNQTEARAALPNATYLQDESVEVDGVRFWGSPWQPEFFDWAFNLPRGKPLQEIWARIPDDTNVLITHGPPLGHGDRTVRGENVGCADLLARIRVVLPRLHVFGHIHEGQGVTHEGPTMCVNASFLDFRYRVSKHPFVVDL